MRALRGEFREQTGRWEVSSLAGNGRNSFSFCPTSTTKTDEVRALLDEMLALLNLSSSRRDG